MAPTTIKIVATSKAALLRKYGLAGFPRIVTALQTLVAADLARGLATTVIDIDTGLPMSPRPQNPTGRPASESATKERINKILKKHDPAYLMILGGPDVVCHQSLNNPMPSDDDPDVPSDLPYASQSPYSKDTTQHLGVTHVVGRLPDLPKATDPAYLLRLIKYAATARTLSASLYQKVFGLSAEVWQNSTRMSVTAITGNTPPAPAVRLAPPTGPALSRKMLGLRAHFINCHGASDDFHFYGQRGGSYPVAMETPDNRGKIVRGCVATAECCYGGQVYNPTPVGDMGLCCGYLEDGAYGFFGSTNIAYGPASGNANADLITQYFLKEVIRNGASTGRACLSARQQFLQAAGPVLNPADLKTIGQFLLLGDPSIHPAAATVSAAREATRAAFGDSKADEAARVARRKELSAKGAALPQTLLAAKKKRKTPPSGGTIRAQLLRLAKGANMKRPRITSFGVDGEARPSPGAKALGALGTPPVVHVLVQPLKGSKKVTAFRALIVHQYASTLVARRDLLSR